MRYRLPLILVSLGALAVGSCQSIGTRWSIATTQPVIIPAINPKGGAAVLAGNYRDRLFALKSYAPTSRLRWEKPAGYLQLASFDRHGYLFAYGSVEQPGLDNYLYYRRFDGTGSIAAQRTFGPFSYGGDSTVRVSSVGFDGLDRPYTIRNFSSESQPDPSASLIVWNRQFGSSFDGGGGITAQGGGGERGGVRVIGVPNGDTYHNVGGTLTRFDALGRRVWSQYNGPYGATISFVVLDGVRIFAKGFFSGDPRRIINEFGVQTGIWGPGDVIAPYDGTSFLSATMRPGSTNALMRFRADGSLMWRRDISNTAAPTSAIKIVGRDRWGYIYLYIEDTGKSLMKVSANGAVVWRIASSSIDQAISPYNGDVFLTQDDIAKRYFVCLHQAPIGRLDDVRTAIAVPVDFDVSSNDENSVDAVYRIFSPPSVGLVTITTKGVARYSPPPGFAGLVTFKYEAKKPGLTTTGPIVVSVRVGI